MRRGRPPWRVLAVAILIALSSACSGAGGPGPCTEDAECEPTCDANCAPAPTISATCDEPLRACVCECDRSGAGGGGGQGGMGGGGECPGGTLVQELWPTAIECDPTSGVAPCDTECPSECLANGFPLGARGAACTRTPPSGSFCDCLCAYCRGG